MIPTKKVTKTPYELWHGQVPKLSYLKVWGCKAHVRRETSSKLESRTIKCIFVGYPKETMGYYFYNPTENKVFVARGAEFLERNLLSQEACGSNVYLEEVREPQNTTPSTDASEKRVEAEHSIAKGQHETPVICRSGRISQQPEKYGFLVTVEEAELGDHCEPASYQEVVSDVESDKWLEAMNAEMQSMKDNQVWNIVDLPPNSKTVGSKWVFKKKTDMDGNVHTFKARLVAKGFTQTHGIDYEETFSPVANIKAIRILIAIVAYYDYEIWQMDVKTAFLNGHLSEDVYMVQPEGFVNRKYPKKVCKLQRSIYGLKQASRSWNLRFDEKIKECGFTQNQDEPCVYIRASRSTVVFLILYVNDILLIGNDIPTLQDVKTWLGKCFAIKDLGEAAYILGIRIDRDRPKRLIGLSQSTYIDKILKRFRMQDSKRGALPMQHGISLSKSQCPTTLDEVKRMSGIRYASAIGSIMYAMLCTRPDVAYALSMTSRYQHNPGECHWTAVKNILKYLRRIKDMFLVYGGLDEELSVKCYTDASFQTDRDDSRSQSGYAVNRGAIAVVTRLAVVRSIAVVKMWSQIAVPQKSALNAAIRTRFLVV